MRNNKFVGRQIFLKEIDSAFDKTNIVVLYGEKGIGKTQLALEYAYLFKEKKKEYVHMIEKNDDVVLNTNKMHKLTEYLNDLNQKGKKVLLIFEILDKYNEIIEKLCDLPNVFILITKTNEDKCLSEQLPSAKIIQLKPFNNDESITYIKKQLEDKIKTNLLKEKELEDLINLFDFSSNDTLPRSLDKLIEIFNFNPIVSPQKKIENIKLDKNQKVLELINQNLLKKN